MLVRHPDPREPTGDEVVTPNWRSRQILLPEDGAGFSLQETTFLPGTVNDFRYAGHVEAVFITQGEGTLTDEETGTTYALRPGTLYAPDRHEHHRLRPRTEMHAVCVFNPPLTGHEDEDNSGDPLVVGPE